MQSIRRKVTPFDLGKAKVRVNVAERSYSHLQQSNINAETDIFLGVTYNTTQTFGSNGQPNDKDNDKN